MQPGAPQRLVGVDVADAADQRLVEQGPLDGGAAPAQGGVEGVVVEGGVEGVAGDVRDDVGEALGIARHGVVQREAAEGALVDEAELGGQGVGEAEADAQVLLVGRALGLDEQLPAHAQVGEDGERRRGGRRRPLDGQPESAAPATWRRTARGCSTSTAATVRPHTQRSRPLRTTSTSGSSGTALLRG